MVTDGGIESTVLKAKYGSDIRKSQLHHSNDLTFNDLLLMMQRIFKIKSSTSVILKYHDAAGDLITLTDDNDLLLAIRTEPSLFIEVFTDADDLAGQLSQLDGLLSNINESAKTLKRTLQNVLQTNSSSNLNERSVSPLASPGAKLHHTESVATIQPSVHEQVDNGHVSHIHDSFPPTNHIKHENLEEELSLHHHEQYKPIQPPQQQFVNQLENVPIDNNGHQHSPVETQRTEEILLNEREQQQQHEYQQFQQQQQLLHQQQQQFQQAQQQQLQNSFSPTPQQHEAYRGTPQFPPASQTPHLQSGFQQPPSSVGGYPPVAPPSATPTSQFQQPPQAQLYKPPASIPGAGVPPPQQFGLPPAQQQHPGQPSVLPPSSFQPGAPRPPSQFSAPQVGQPGLPPMGQPPVSQQQYGGLPPPGQQVPGVPPGQQQFSGGQFPPAGPTPPPTAFGAPPGGPGGFNPFARAPAPASYGRQTFGNNY
uniref:PB1 domain-containing protein n=1 Tax=Acrobeloides nanus TaxID=290746 RepID=A0A914C9J1_9BILA